jgi:hypothetical protein
MEGAPVSEKSRPILISGLEPPPPSVIAAAADKQNNQDDYEQCGRIHFASLEILCP